MTTLRELMQVALDQGAGLDDEVRVTGTNVDAVATGPAESVAPGDDLVVDVELDVRSCSFNVAGYHRCIVLEV